MRIGELVKELRDFNKDARLPVQSGVIGPVVKTTNDDLIIWRITEAQAAHEPSSMDEVRDDVVRDATAQARYDALVLKAAQIGEEAKKDGLDAVAKTYGSSVEKAPSVHLADPAVLRQYGIRFPETCPRLAKIWMPSEPSSPRLFHCRRQTQSAPCPTRIALLWFQCLQS